MEQESKNSSKEFEEKSAIITTSPKKSNVIEIEEKEEIEEISDKESISRKNKNIGKDEVSGENRKNENSLENKEDSTINDLKKKIDDIIKFNIKNENKIKELINSNDVNQRQIKELINSNDANQRQINELLKYKEKFLKVIGALNEVNNQNEKYIKYNLNIKFENLKCKFDLLLDSYKVLFIRKVANIFLMELYSRYSSYIKEVNFRMNHNKKHLVTICVKDIQGVDKQIINLIIDFLKFIKRKTSSMIHIQDENFEFQKEILYEAIDKKIPNTEESGINISLEEAIDVIFQKKKEKVKELPKKDKTFYKKMKNLISSEIDGTNNSDEKEKNSEKCDDDNSEGIFDEKAEEERIKKILSGDENSIDTNLNSILNQLLNKIKLNREIVEPDKKLNKIEIIDGTFFFNSWKESFETEKIKSDETYKLYIDKNKIGSLANMGAFLGKLLKGLKFNFYMIEPNKLDKKFNA